MGTGGSALSRRLLASRLLCFSILYQNCFSRSESGPRSVHLVSILGPRSVHLVSILASRVPAFTRPERAPRVVHAFPGMASPLSLDVGEARLEKAKEWLSKGLLSESEFLEAKHTVLVQCGLKLVGECEFAFKKMLICLKISSRAPPSYRSCAPLWHAPSACDGERLPLSDLSGIFGGSIHLCSQEPDRSGEGPPAPADADLACVVSTPLRCEYPSRLVGQTSRLCCGWLGLRPKPRSCGGLF